MDHIPVLRVGNILLVSIQVEIQDQQAIALQEDLAEEVVKHRARGVVIDISSLEMVDSFIGRMLANLASVAHILDAETIVVGMKPAVAMTMVELGVSLHGVRTALDMARGMALLEDLVAGKDG